MPQLREDTRTGLSYLETATELLQRVRLADPAAGLYEAAEIQWFWSNPRSTDDLPQLFWFDADGRPAAAFIAIDFGDGSSLTYEDPTLVVISMPGATPETIAHIVDRGLTHLREHGISSVELEVDRADDAMRQLLHSHGFKLKGDALVLCWLDADARPDISALADGYRLLSRAETIGRPHHMAGARRPDIDERLQQTSLYRLDLDLVVVDGEDRVAGWGMFWHDPVTAIGVVEPMRTQDDHQRRGVARHILTSGVDRLARAGAQRINIGFGPDNTPAEQLYTSIGFTPHLRTDVFVGTSASPD